MLAPSPPSSSQPLPSAAPARPTEQIPSEIADTFKREKDGQLLWFAAPPAHVTPLSQPAHSVAYLNWKHKTSTDASQ